MIPNGPSHLLQDFFDCTLQSTRADVTKILTKYCIQTCTVAVTNVSQLKNSHNSNVCEVNVQHSKVQKLFKS